MIKRMKNITGKTESKLIAYYCLGILNADKNAAKSQIKHIMITCDLLMNL